MLKVTQSAFVSEGCQTSIVVLGWSLSGLISDIWLYITILAGEVGHGV